MLPDSSSPNRMPAPSPCKSCVVSKAGWITALVGLLLAIFFFFQYLTASSEAKLQRNNAALTQIELQSLKQQLYAERILAERQISDLNNTTKTDPLVFVSLIAPDTQGPQAQGVLVWAPLRQSGTLFAEQLPATGTDEELRLWIEDGSGASCPAGSLIASAGHTTRLDFSSEKPIKKATRFLLTREHKGATAPTGPTIFAGTP